ncbi:MAG: AmmeMemoRadiSam system protein B [Gammaproteobacteria bacterium]|nr:MAG: AmmeMemoRadiSam system protein B [Gammaproteobacteria bacterium]HDY83125.1 AmmeMemoRadiSam system protein B [Halieaceae bacterium]
MTIRQAAVAGSFYEADASHLQQRILSLMSGAHSNTPYSVQALIVPHAGYVYSGATAAEAYRTVAPLADRIERVVLFGPAHRVALQGMAVPSVDAFATPLGDVPLDRESIARVAAMPGVCVSDEAHREEHSLEVQLPFLQTVLKHFSLVPVVVGHCAPRTVASVMDALWGGPETLLVVSTDLSHFHTYDDATQLDTLTCERLQAKDSSLCGQDACGAYALNGLMSTGHCQSLQVELVDRCNSGDTAGSKDRVVGYGAFVLH